MYARAPSSSDLQDQDAGARSDAPNSTPEPNPEPKRSRFTLSPINRRRWENFKANKRGYWSFWIFMILFTISMLANFIANDKPLLVTYQGGVYFPVVKFYPETAFGGVFETQADFRDPVVQELITSKGGTMIWPPIPYDYKTIKLKGGPYPSAPSLENPLGTDDGGHDVLARVIYGFRISVLFGLILTLCSSVIGVAAGAIQGYFGGLIDLIFQRIIEIWTSVPGAVSVADCGRDGGAVILDFVRHQCWCLAGCASSMWCAPSS